MSNRILYAYDDSIWETVYDFNPSEQPVKFTLDPGKYLFICYGGAGGSITASTSWGYGAAAYGVFETDTSETMYAVVGGNGGAYGESSLSPGKGGYNGGGDGGEKGAGGANPGSGGGGASDIRLTLDPELVPMPGPPSLALFPQGWIEEGEPPYGPYLVHYDAIEYVLTREYFDQVSDAKYVYSTGLTVTFKELSYLHPYGRYEIELMLPEHILYNNLSNYIINLDDNFKIYALTNTERYPVLKMKASDGNNYTYHADIREPLPVNKKIRVIITNYLITFMDEFDNEINRISFDKYIYTGMPIFLKVGGTLETVGTRIYHVKTYYQDEEYLDMYPCVKEYKDEESGPVTSYRIGEFYTITDVDSSYWDVSYTHINDETYENTLNPVHRPISKSLLSRIIVAAGGGGAPGSITGNPQYKIAYGGGEVSGFIDVNPTTANQPFIGATTMLSATDREGFKFGRGMDAGKKISITNPGCNGSGGGGGGWFGGYAVLFGGQQNQGGVIELGLDSNKQGTGGSSYVYTNTSWTPANYIPTSKYQLTSPSLIPCQSSYGRIIICKLVKIITNGDRIISPLTGKPTKIDIFPGIYKLKCWGAEGGSSNLTSRVAGGYSEGVLTLTENIDLYSVVGGSGMFYDLIPSENNPLKWNPVAGYNGGGTSFYQDGLINKNFVPCGGGATDFRISLDDTTLNPVDQDIRTDLPKHVFQLKGFNTQSSGHNNIGYFDTSYIMTPTTRIECEFEVISNFPGRGTSYCAIFGAQNGSSFSADSYAFFVYTNGDKTSLCIGTNIIEGPVISKDTRISLTATANSVTWTDGETTETIESTESAISGLRTLYVGGVHYSNTSVTNKTSMRIYSFKIYNNDVLVRDFVPAINPSDATNKMYEVLSNTFVTYSATHANILFVDNPTRSLLSRIIVAGGGGSQAGTASTPGKGGGTSGGTVSNGSGNSGGGGTQTGIVMNQNYPQIIPGFGYGGNGMVLLNNAANGAGAGGGGWFGGTGSFYASNDARGKGGNGGSGYILTETSFKPTGYIPTEHCYMTEGITTLGGNDLPPNISKAEIEVIEATPVKIVLYDSAGYKRYDEDEEMWVYFSNTITPEMVEEYGVYKIPNLNGVNETFNIIVNDPSNVVANAEITYMPKKQDISFLLPKRYKINNALYDIEYDETKFDMTFGIAPYDEEYNAYTLSIDKLEESDEFRLYMIQLFEN